MTKEIIREIIPPGVTLQIQTLSNEIFEVNEQYHALSLKNSDLTAIIQAKDKYIETLERQAVDLHKQVKRAQSDFNQAEKRSFSAKKDIEFLRSIKIS